MEDTLRGWKRANNVMNIKVLILVLMEDTLRDHDCKRFEVEVLILVLMEDTLRV